MRYLLLLPAALLLVSCGGPATNQDSATTTPAMADSAGKLAAPAGWVDADLSAEPAKMPVIVKAPAEFTIGTSPMGGAELTSEKATFDMDDVTEQGAAALTSKKEEVKTNSGMVFEKFVLEQPDGFIAQMGASNFIPVRLVKAGGHTYQFSVIPLNALPSEEAARQLYDIAAQARAK